jgi:hypothetical protein
MTEQQMKSAAAKAIAYVKELEQTAPHRLRSPKAAHWLNKVRLSIHGYQTGGAVQSLALPKPQHYGRWWEDEYDPQTRDHITSDQARAIREHTGGYHENIAQLLYQGDPDDIPYRPYPSTHEHEIIQHLDAALLHPQARLPRNMSLYRGISRKTMARIANMQSGDVWVNKGYLSTSLDRELAENWKGYGPDHDVVHIAAPRGTHGLLLGPLSQNASESEVLLPRLNHLLYQGRDDTGARHFQPIGLGTPNTPALAGKRIFYAKGGTVGRNRFIEDDPNPIIIKREDYPAWLAGKKPELSKTTVAEERLRALQDAAAKKAKGD